MNKTLYLALGTNLGERQENIEKALRLVGERIGKVEAVSACHETEPVGFKSDNLFLNAVAQVTTDLEPEQVLDETERIEQEMGRDTKSEGGRYADRIIDIDVLCYDTLQCHTERLQLPHPAVAERRFVLEPLCEIAPELVMPGQELNVKQLLERLNVARIEELDDPARAAEVVDDISRLLAQLSSKTKSISVEKLANVVAAPNVHVYLLYDELGTVNGMTTLAVDRLLTGTKVWVEDVVVDARCRCRGYARQLLAFMEQEGKRLGAASLNLTSRPAREAANRLYRRAGYVQRETNVYKLTLA